MVKSQPLPQFPNDVTASPDDASAVGLTELVSHDLGIVKLYRELATHHDALVDAVTTKLQDQAK